MLTLAVEVWEAVAAFFDAGGEVLNGIFLVTFMMWAVIVERFVYYRWVFPKEAARELAAWQQREDKTSWFADQRKRRQLSLVGQKLNRALPMLKTLIALCPLLGLLGTVTGMIEVFDVMAIAGSGNPRAMASGVSRATIPTMAGMVGALSGLYFSARLGKLAGDRTRHFEEELG